MREAALPPQWACLAGKVLFVQQHSPTEWSSTCPECGGAVHPSGEWPDRCRLFADEHPTLFCRRCGLVAYPDQYGDKNYTPPTPQELERFRQERIAAEEARKRSAERALALLQDQRLWERYYLQAGKTGREYWERRGIPGCWQDFWQLGYIEQREFYIDGAPYYTATATIPLFAQGAEVVNIKHRLIDPPRQGKDKYRYEISGQPAPMFLCDPDKPVAGHVVAVEGEIKAAVTFARLDDPNVTMVGLPGVTPPPGVVSQLSQAERVTLVTDPGSQAETWRLCKQVGLSKTRVLIPPVKVDDMILASRLSRQDVASLLSQAKPLV